VGAAQLSRTQTCTCLHLTQDQPSCKRTLAYTCLLRLQKNQCNTQSPD
jgi:hypothetical protein